MTSSPCSNLGHDTKLPHGSVDLGAGNAAQKLATESVGPLIGGFANHRVR